MLTRLPDRRPGGRAVVVYTLLRMALFVVVGAVAAVAGLRGLPLLVVALLGSGIASWFLLRGPRARVSVALEGVMRRWHDRTAAEDEYVDSLMADQGITRSDR